MTAPGTIDVSVLEGTCLAALRADVAGLLLATAQMHDVPAGRPVFPDDDGGTRIGVLLTGSARSYLTAADGRQLTVRYGRPGSLTGRRSDLAGDHEPIRIQAVTDCRVLELGLDTVMRVAREEVSVAIALVNELSVRLLDVYATVADTAFGSMRQRVVRHLLALAETRPPVNGRPIAVATQQQLADGIGSSREVVARVLGLLRNEGLIRTAPREIEILDMRRLASYLGEWRTEDRRLEPDLSFEAERLLEASPNAVVVVDRDGVVVFANASVERVFGWPAADLVGLPIEILVPERTRPVHTDQRAKFLEAPAPRPMGLGRELHGRRRDGSEFPVAASLTTIDTRDGALVIATVVELEPSEASGAEPALPG